MNFKLHSNYQPRGDQPAAIDQLYRGVEAGEKHQVLLGVTGSGKTFTMAKLIEQAGRPALVLAHNKTLAAQLYHEFKGFFPENAVEYFVSYYDFYQPEAYVPSADIYIDKEATINDELDKLRMSATRSLFERRDVVIVASVSCIYGLGSPEAYYGMLVMLEKGHQTSREALLRRFVDIQYERSEDLRRGTFRVRGDMIEIYPTYEDQGYRIEMWGDQIDALRQIDPLTGEVRAGQEDLSRVPIYPKTHYVMPQEQRDRAIVSIQEELWWWKKEMEKLGKFVEAQRVVQRTMFDIEMMRTIGYCHGIENYSRHLSGRLPGEAPPTLLDYVPQDYLLFIDESHQTVGQVRGMFNGDRARKQTLRRDRGAGDSANGPGGSPGGNSSRERPGGRPAGRDSRARGEERARAGHHADEAHVGGSVRVFYGDWRQVPLFALGSGNAGPHQNFARLAARRI